MNQFIKLWYLIAHPVRFFEENNDDSGTLSKFALFIVRLSLAIELIGILAFVFIQIFINGQPITFTFKIGEIADIIFYAVAFLLFVFFIQANAAAIIVEQFGKPINWLVKRITGQDNLLKATRISVYNTPFFLFCGTNISLFYILNRGW